MAEPLKENLPTPWLIEDMRRVMLIKGDDSHMVVRMVLDHEPPERTLIDSDGTSQVPSPVLKLACFITIVTSCTVPADQPKFFLAVRQALMEASRLYRDNPREFKDYEKRTIDEALSLRNQVHRAIDGAHKPMPRFSEWSEIANALRLIHGKELKAPPRAPAIEERSPDDDLAKAAQYLHQFRTSLAMSSLIRGSSQERVRTAAFGLLDLPAGALTAEKALQNIREAEDPVRALEPYLALASAYQMGNTGRGEPAHYVENFFAYLKQEVQALKKHGKDSGEFKRYTQDVVGHVLLLLGAYRSHPDLSLPSVVEADTSPSAVRSDPRAQSTEIRRQRSVEACVKAIAAHANATVSNVGSSIPKMVNFAAGDETQAAHLQKLLETHGMQVGRHGNGLVVGVDTGADSSMTILKALRSMCEVLGIDPKRYGFSDDRERA